MTGLRRLLVAMVAGIVLIGSPLTTWPAQAVALPSVVASSVPTALLQELLSLDQGLFTALPTPGGLRFNWLASSVEFSAGNHGVVASGAGAPPLELRSPLAGATNASSVAGRVVVDSQPSTGRDVVYVPFDGGVETLDVLAGPASPRTSRWGVTSGGQPLLVDVDQGTASTADGTVVARFDGVSAFGADGQSVDVTLRGGLGFLEMEVPADLAAASYPVVIDPTWNRTTKTYREDRAPFFRGHNYRVRGYNFRACVEIGVNCRTAAGDYRPEATAQAHAIRRLSKIHGSAGPFLNTVPNELDWEAGKRDDRIEEPPCDGTAGFRVDIVLDVSGLLDIGGRYRLIEAKNVNNAGQVEGQLNCYLLKMGSGGDRLNVGRLGDLSDEQWAVFWFQEDTGTKWYGWAPQPGYVLFGNEDDRAAGRIPQWVTDQAHQTGDERISLPATPSVTPVPVPVPAPVPIPVP